jgi:hypothetical protein
LGPASLGSAGGAKVSLPLCHLLPAQFPHRCCGWILADSTPGWLGDLTTYYVTSLDFFPLIYKIEAIITLVLYENEMN